MVDSKTNPEQVYQKDRPTFSPPIGYKPTSWDDVDDDPKTSQVKLCRLEDPTCEACQ